MNILVVFPLVPWPPDQGDRLRAWEMLQALAAAGTVTAVLLPSGPVAPEALRRLRDVCGRVASLSLGTAARAGAAAAGALRGLPPAVATHWSGAAVRAVAAEVPGPWDLACAFQWRAAPFVRAVPARLRVLEMTDALGLYRRRLPARGRALRQRLGLMGVERLERTWHRGFDAAWIASDADADWVERLSGRRPSVVPNGCSPVASPAPYHPSGPLLFLGNMRYPPNEDGVLWLVRRVWPQARAALGPAARLRLVGVPSPRVASLARVPGVEVAGRVPDAAAELAAASAAINPVRFGGGTNRKVLDAWAAARPVISTPAGARGFACDDGIHLLLASSPQEWVERLRWVQSHPAEAAALGRRGWEFAAEALDARRLWAEALAPLLAAAGAG